MASYRYPQGNLNKNSDFLEIGIVNYVTNPLVRGGNAPNVGSAVTFTAGSPFTVKSGSNRKNTKRLLHQILLPIPSNIQDGNSVKYTEGSLDGLTASTLGIVLNAFYANDENPGETLINLLKKGTDLGLDPGARQYFMNNLAVAAATIPFGGNLTASQLLARQTGNILNPNMELLFDGVTLRTFKFSFKLTPRSEKEATEVKNIIRTLKQNMAPGFSQSGFDNQTSSIKNLYLSTPKIFELTYKKGSQNHPFLHRFKQCFLTDMSVNYTGEGTYATYGGSIKNGGGTPVSMIMDLGFKELEPIYADDYNSAGGVGY